ncbi:hypothetical protein ACFYYY_18840 [Streptomyces sp. NPDC001834]|uniref:hypothetical protein n=1 Tax=Streptomyces sp. NPDC001834 TaxID=3364616 RepID=UPI0036922C31
MSIITGDTVRHLLWDPKSDLLPRCGQIPGPDKVTGDWHTVHGRDTLLQCAELGLPGCITCLSPGALGEWTPLIFDEEPVFDSDVPVWEDEGWRE